MIKGDLVFPVYDESAQKITAAYAEEFSSLTSTAGKFTSITLSGYLAGALSKVSRSLINNNDFNLTSFVINKMAEAIADFLRKELIHGTEGKMTGLLSSDNKVTAKAATAITADELIDLQMAVPQVYQSEAVWVMSRDTFKAIRKLKDGDGNYLLNKDATKAFGWELLGPPRLHRTNLWRIWRRGKSRLSTATYPDFTSSWSKRLRLMCSVKNMQTNM